MIEPTYVDFLLFGEKKCCSCGTPLPANSDFFPPDRTRNDGLKQTCRECKCRQARESYARDPEKALAKCRAYRDRMAAAS